MFKIILIEGYLLADYTRICSAIAHLGDEDLTFVFLGRVHLGLFHMTVSFSSNGDPNDLDGLHLNLTTQAAHCTSMLVDLFSVKFSCA